MGRSVVNVIIPPSNSTASPFLLLSLSLSLSLSCFFGVLPFTLTHKQLFITNRQFRRRVALTGQGSSNLALLEGQRQLAETACCLLLLTHYSFYQFQLTPLAYGYSCMRETEPCWPWRVCGVNDLNFFTAAVYRINTITAVGVLHARKSVAPSQILHSSVCAEFYLL